MKEKISEKEFALITSFLHTHYGIHMGAEKRALVVGRLEAVLRQHKFKSFSEFYEYLINDQTGEALTTLINRLTTNHTFFMRETQHFKFLQQTVLPYLEATVPDRDLRIWSAGCSSGEEAYTLAMLLADHFERSPKAWDTRILATDISTAVLSKATQGLYSNEQLAMLPAHWRKKYFTAVNENESQVIEQIRHNVIYRNFNLNNKFPFKGKFHVIFCRNVMIYFAAAEKDRLLDKFYEYTETGGYLFIGHSEAINRDRTPYRYVMPAVYRKD